MSDIYYRQTFNNCAPYSAMAAINVITKKEIDPKPIYEAFYRNLDFGTSGLRGIMGAGTNRMNVNVEYSP